jgi:hypothetical protein
MTNLSTSSRKFLVMLAAAAALFAVGCAHAGHKGAVSTEGGPRPSWIDAESPEFPRAMYIVGVGSADDEASAAERARAEVAKVFSVAVAATTTSSESESTAKQNGGETHSYSQDLAQKVRTVTDKALEGVDIVARWKDTSSMRYYALAALPKDHALLAVTEKASEIDSEIAQQRSLFAAAADSFSKAKAAAKLLALSKARESLSADSRVLGGGNLPGDFDAGAIRSQAVQALAALNVVVSVTGEGSEATQTGVVAGLNAVGLSAKAGAPGDASDLTATAQVSVEEQNGGSRWRRFRSSANVSLIDGRSGKTFSTFVVTAREDAVDSGEARRRSLASLAKSTSDKVTSAINDFFANQ